MINAAEVIRLIVMLIVLGLVWYLLSWLLDYTNPPEPFKKVGRVLLAVVAVLFLVSVLLSLVGVQVWRWGP